MKSKRVAGDTGSVKNPHLPTVRSPSPTAPHALWSKLPASHRLHRPTTAPTAGGYRTRPYSVRFLKPFDDRFHELVPAEQKMISDWKRDGRLLEFSRSAMDDADPRVFMTFRAG